MWDFLSLHPWWGFFYLLSVLTLVPVGLRFVLVAWPRRYLRCDSERVAGERSSLWDAFGDAATDLEKVLYHLDKVAKTGKAEAVEEEEAVEDSL